MLSSHIAKRFSECRAVSVCENRVRHTAVRNKLFTDRMSIKIEYYVSSKYPYFALKLLENTIQLIKHYLRAINYTVSSECIPNLRNISCVCVRARFCQRIPVFQNDQGPLEDSPFPTTGIYNFYLFFIKEDPIATGYKISELRQNQSISSLAGHHCWFLKRTHRRLLLMIRSH